jgi:glutathione S-transferase
VNAGAKIVLRYFDARGRAQFMRYYLAHRGFPYQDERVPLDENFAAWLSMRNDRTLTGPFQKLPVLQWDEQLVPETLVIRSFVHDASGDAARLSPEENLRHALLSSSVCDDVMTPVILLIWSELVFSGLNLPTVARQTLDRVRRHLTVLEQTLREWYWLERLADRPLMLADCLLWEELSVAQQVFGDHLRLDDTVELACFYRECPGREAFESALAAHSCQISGRPNEAEAISRIRAALAD